MNQKAFLAGICGILLVFVMVFTGCPTGTQEVEGTVNAPSVEAAVVTATPVPGGVKLEWTPVIDVENYIIWRGTPETENRLIGTNTGFDPEANKCIYYDLKSETNDLAAATEYTYTVVAVSASKTLTDSRAVVVATPETIPEKGTKLAAPTGVTLALNPDEETITVSWTAGEGIPTGNYDVRFYRDGSSFWLNEDYSLTLTSRVYSWPSSSQSDGKYTVGVTANAYTYYKDSAEVISAEVAFESLFRTGAYISVSNSYSPSISGGIANLRTSFSFYSISKPDVTYSVERAPADSVGTVTGDYAAVPLSYSAGDNLAAADLKADVLGNLGVSNVYDKTVVDGSSYKYRVKATKGDKTQTKEVNSFITIDSRENFSTSIRIAPGVTGTGKVTYEVSINYALKGALKDGDSLVLYYAKGNNIQPQNGPYEELVRFTAAELEKSVVTPEDGVVPKAGSDNTAYVQVYVEYAPASGRPRKEITNSLQTGGGVSSRDRYPAYVDSSSPPAEFY
jgi:hypothetical protein